LAAETLGAGKTDEMWQAVFGMATGQIVVSASLARC